MGGHHGPHGVVDEDDLGAAQLRVVADESQPVAGGLLTARTAGHLDDGDRQGRLRQPQLPGRLVVHDDDGVRAAAGGHGLDRHVHQRVARDLERRLRHRPPVPDPQARTQDDGDHRL